MSKIDKILPICLYAVLLIINIKCDILDTIPFLSWRQLICFTETFSYGICRKFNKNSFWEVRFFLYIWKFCVGGNRTVHLKCICLWIDYLFVDRIQIPKAGTREHSGMYLVFQDCLNKNCVKFEICWLSHFSLKYRVKWDHRSVHFLECLYIFLTLVSTAKLVSCATYTSLLIFC